MALRDWGRGLYIWRGDGGVALSLSLLQSILFHNHWQSVCIWGCECVYHDVYVCGWGYTHNPGHGVSSEHGMFVAICGGMVSSEGVYYDMWLCWRQCLICGESRWDTPHQLRSPCRICIQGIGTIWDWAYGEDWDLAMGVSTAGGYVAESWNYSFIGNWVHLMV